MRVDHLSACHRADFGVKYHTSNCTILARPESNEPKECTIVIMLAFLVGVVAGLRALTAPADVAWAVALGWFDV